MLLGCKTTTNNQIFTTIAEWFGFQSTCSSTYPLAMFQLIIMIITFRMLRINSMQKKIPIPENCTQQDGQITCTECLYPCLNELNCLIDHFCPTAHAPWTVTHIRYRLDFILHIQFGYLRIHYIFTAVWCTSAIQLYFYTASLLCCYVAMMLCVILICRYSTSLSCLKMSKTTTTIKTCDKLIGMRRNKVWMQIIVDEGWRHCTSTTEDKTKDKST